MTAYKIASVAVCYNFIRRDRSWNWISNLVARLDSWTLANWKPKNSWNQHLFLLVDNRQVAPCVLYASWANELIYVVVPRSCRPILHVSVSAVSVLRHRLCGTTFRLNWVTVTLAEGVSNVAWSHRFLNVPTRNRRLWELCLRGAI